MMYAELMRTTITLDDDIAAEVDRLRRTTGIGPSEAINRLARAGLTVALGQSYHLEVPSYRMSARVDYTNIAATLELLQNED